MVTYYTYFHIINSKNQTLQMMNTLFNPFHHHLTIFFFLLFIFSTKISYSSRANSSSINFCPEIERNSLLIFKQSLQDSGNRLSSWNGEAMKNCCKWEGVVCSNSSGHVSHLHLQTHNLGGKINSSLSNLKHLTYLDLSCNNFHGEAIPSFIGSLSSLEYLNLSHARFEGKIPSTIGYLSNLRTLDLGRSDFLVEMSDDQLKSDNLEWLSELFKLEYLNMNYADLSRAKNWGEVISSLPRLLELRLRSCSIDPSPHLHAMNNLTTSLTLIDVSENTLFDDKDDDHSFFPIPQWFFHLESLVHLDLHGNAYSGGIPTVSNATKLQFLDLSWNYINSSNIPDWIYSCKDLRVLDLSENSIQGEISEAIMNLTSLKTLDLSANSIRGQIPKAIGNLTSLESLHLGSNKLSGIPSTHMFSSMCKLRSLVLFGNELEGELHDSFENMSECFLKSLHDLDLSHNHFSGYLTEQFGEFRVLESLSLRNNSLSGTLPITIGNLSSLVYLLLDGNKFTGNLPVSLGPLSELVEFEVEGNRLEGIVTESHFANLSKLETFSASGNHLNLSVGPDWIPPVRVVDLRLGSWRLGAGTSQIPSWLQTSRRNIDYLDVSNTGISGTPPSWFFTIPFLNISNNNLHGHVPYSSNDVVDMSRNNFSGPLPRIKVDMWGLDLSHNSFSEGLFDFLCNETYSMNTLLLEGNRLSGELPDCWEKWQTLEILNLANNSLSGRLPNSLGFLGILLSLNLYGNSLSGQIPFSMRNCTSLLKMDLGSNNLDGNVPTWIGTSLTKVKILILRSNKFNGEIPSELCHLQSVQILDLSGNGIRGAIPKCLHNLTAMVTKRVLNDAMQISYIYGYKESASVATKGLEFEYTTILSLVTNIDLSSNNLSGGIPKELTRLVQLRSLNLSRNHLTGSIPLSIGEMKQLESLDLSRNDLTGRIPKNITLLSALSFLNLSFNNLSGRIPQSTQLQTMDASSFVGNDLCGPPLAKNCSNGDGGKNVHGHEKGGERKGEIEWMYVFLSSGYAVGFSGVCSVLVMKKPWRDAYFGFLERIWDKLYVYFHVWIQRFC